MSRRSFFGRSASIVGLAALADLLGRDGWAQTDGGAETAGGLAGLPHFPPRAKRVIYLFQSGGPSHLDLFDYKPILEKMAGQDLPASVRQGQRQSAMTVAQQTGWPLMPSAFAFAQHGQSGAWF